MNTEWQHDQARCLFRTLQPSGEGEIVASDLRESKMALGTPWDEEGRIEKPDRDLRFFRTTASTR